jgi:hypothetical protein
MDANLDPTLASRYLANQLSDQERHDYEALLLSSPEAVSELEATARLKVGLAKLRDTGELDYLLQKRPRAPLKFLLPLAAALAIIAIGVTLWRSKPVHSGRAPQLFASHASLAANTGHPLSITITTALYLKRAGVPAERIEKPATPAEMVLRVLPNPLNKSHRYRLSLARLQGAAAQVIADISNLTPTAEDGFIECYTDSARLTPGRYEVIVTDQATSPGGPAGVLMFDLVTK